MKSMALSMWEDRDMYFDFKTCECNWHCTVVADMECHPKSPVSLHPLHQVQIKLFKTGVFRVLADYLLSVYTNLSQS